MTLLFFTDQSHAQQKVFSSRKIVKHQIYQQSLSDVWSRWTTHEGLKTFFGKDNQIELYPNGAFEIYFLLDQPKGMRGSEDCKVLSLLPKKYFSFSWNVPPNFTELRKSNEKTWVVVEFDSINAKQTAVTLTHLGWPEDEKWTPVFNYFTESWGVVFRNLSKYDEVLALPADTSRKVTGLGGVFFKCKDPKKIKAWYGSNLGLNIDDYGTTFEWRQSDDSSKGYTQWSPFSSTTKYFEPSVKEFMINYRVLHIEELLEKLKQAGVTITDQIETYDYGKFVHIMDPEGNKIELWEPPVSK